MMKKVYIEPSTEVVGLITTPIMEDWSQTEFIDSDDSGDTFIGDDEEETTGFGQSMWDNVVK